MRIRIGVVAAIVAAATAIHAQTPAPATPDSLVTAAKRAAGQDHAGTFLRICVAPDNLGGGGGGGRAGRAGTNPPPAPTVPDRATWYAQPYKVFDNLYFIGTKIHSSWALTTTQGIIVIDTLFRRIPGLRPAVPVEELSFKDDATVYGIREFPVTW